MKNRRRGGTWYRTELGSLAVCAGLIAVADLVLIGHPWFIEGDWELAAMSLPLAQCSLAALWSGTGRTYFPIRFALPPIASITAWLVLTRILPWGIGEPASAAWALALLVQTLAIVMTLKVCKPVDRWNQSESRAPRLVSARSRLAFDLRTLMLWVTVIACVLSFVSYARHRWAWSANAANREFLEATSLVGLFNAIVGLIWLWSLADGNFRVRRVRVPLTTVLMVGLAFPMCKVLAWATTAPGMEVRTCHVLILSQSVVIATVLATYVYLNTSTKQATWNAPSSASRQL